MHQDELDELIEQTKQAQDKLQKLLAASQKKIKEEENTAKKERAKAQADDAMRHASDGGGMLFASRSDTHEDRADEAEKHSAKLKRETIPRLDRELSKIQDGLNELYRDQRTIEGILQKADAWRRSLESTLYDVNRESLD